MTLGVYPKQLSDGGPSGAILGQSSTDLIAFYNATPIAQPSGNNQKAVTQGTAAGSICTMAINVSPSSILTITTTEKAMTPVAATGSWRPTANDLLYINKPTSQAGLGVGNVRVSATGVVGVTFSNFTGSTITPTTSEIYGIVGIRGFAVATSTLTPAAVLANTIVEQQFTVTGVRAGELVQVSKPTAQAGLDIMGCRAVSNNTLGITFGNVTAATITPTAGESYSIVSLGGMDATDCELVLQVNVGSITTIATTTTAEQGVTVTNLLATDIVKGVSKPTAQAGILIAGYRVSAAGSLGITFGNVTSGTLTPTTSEVYGVTLMRQAPVAPLVLYSQSLAPVSVAANTTAEQTFTVTGLISGSMAWVNKPTATAGLGIVGCRVSATNTLAITYGNATATAIVPPTETYVIGNFQQLIDVTGTSCVQSAVLSHQQKSVLVNGLRSAHVNLGLIAGS